MEFKGIEEYGILVREDGLVIGRSGKELKGFFDKDGYRKVSVSFLEDNKRVKRNRFVHRLVARAFLDDYSEDLVVNHLDCNNTNNHFTNLEMTTVRGNTIHAIENGLMKCRGEDCYFNKYPKEFVVKILEELKSVKRYDNGNIKAGELVRIADKLGTTRHVVKNYSRRRKIWKHL